MFFANLLYKNIHQNADLSLYVAVVYCTLIFTAYDDVNNCSLVRKCMFCLSLQ